MLHELMISAIVPYLVGGCCPFSAGPEDGIAASVHRRIRIGMPSFQGLLYESTATVIHEFSSVYFSSFQNLQEQSGPYPLVSGRDDEGDSVPCQLYMAASLAFCKKSFSDQVSYQGIAGRPWNFLHYF